MYKYNIDPITVNSIVKDLDGAHYTERVLVMADVPRRGRPRYAPYVREVYDAVGFFLKETNADRLSEEHAWVLTLDTRGKILGLNEISKGTINMSPVSAVQVAKPPMLLNGASFILFHNHPSGEPGPSDEDRQLTDRFKNIFKEFGLNFLDHIVIGSNKYYSFAQNGEM